MAERAAAEPTRAPSPAATPERAPVSPAAEWRRSAARPVAHRFAAVAVTRAGGRAGGGAPVHVHRTISEAALPTTPVAEIMADETYIDRGLERIEFYTAEVAILHYEDGTTLRLGLVPEYIEDPIQGVDYRSRGHVRVASAAGDRGGTTFVPNLRQMNPPAGITVGELIREAGRRVTFTHHPSGRIVPTEVNDITAPRLCAALREAEAEYVRRFDAMSRGAVEILEKLELIIVLASLLPSGGGSAGLREGARRGAAAAGGRAASGVLARAQAQLARLFSRLLGRGGTMGRIVVEGVEFQNIRVFMEGTTLVVRRFSIQNLSRIAGRGRMVHTAFEQAAVQAAREAGATTAKVSVEMIINPRWRAYLESLGYVVEVLPSGTGFSKVWSRVLTL